MESSKKVVFFCCCFFVFLGFCCLHSWHERKKVIERGEPIPMGCFEVKEIKGGKYAHAEILYNGKTYRVLMDGSYCYYDSIKSLKLYYDAERDSMVESHKAVSDAHWIPFFFAIPVVMIFCYIRERKKLKKIDKE